MASVLAADERLSASVVVNASADAVYGIVSDVTRIREWSPETVRTAWAGPDGTQDRFASWNRRNLAVWKTAARVTSRVPGREFGFIVELPGGQDWTEWTYRVEPGPDGTCALTEEFRLCMALPLVVRAYELLFLFVRDRRTDLQANLQTCVERIKAIAES
jgi:hypothetical protein